MKRMLMIAALILLTAVTVYGQDATLNYQGVLREASGRAVEDGEYNITFSLYEQETGGTAVWTETHNGVNVKNGVFSVDLGTVESLSGVAFDRNYWLGISVGSDGEMSPRIRLTSAPYALSLTGADNTFPSSGNVGINTTTPGAQLEVRAPGDWTAAEGFNHPVEIYDTSGGGWELLYMGADDARNESYIEAVGDNSSSHALLLNPRGGNVGINTSSPDIDLAIGDDDTGFNQITDGELAFCTNNQERMRLDAGGRLGIGHPNPYKPLHIRSETHNLFIEDPEGAAEGWTFDVKAGGDLRIDYWINDNGWSNRSGYGIFDQDNCEYQESSDVSLKKNIEDLGPVITNFLQLHPVLYHYNDTPDTEPKTYGFLAQEVQPLFPELVGSDEDDGTLTLSYSKFSVIAVAAIHELHALVVTQQAEIDQLQTEMQEVRDALIAAGLLTP